MPLRLLGGIFRMIVKQQLVNKIKDYFELNVYETKVWLALLSKGMASAGEVAKISGVPRSRIYDVLESLERKGFVILKLGKPVKSIGIQPRMILEKMKNNVRKKAEEKIISLSNIKETEEFIQLEKLYGGNKDSVRRDNTSAALNGKSNISNHLKEILKNTEKELIVCASVKDIKNKLKIFHQTFNELGKNNVKINVALSGSEEIIKQIEKILKMKIKKVDVSAKFFIIDRREILFYLNKGSSSKEDSAIWLNSVFFSEAFATLFENSLKKSQTNKV